MSDIMEGVRILEVAEHTFVPAASAILADWGAEVIKVEHPERGDAMRGLASSGVMPSMGAVHVLLEHSNRGKKSIGIDVSTEKGLDLIYRLAATCDVFLTNKVPAVRKKIPTAVPSFRPVTRAPTKRSERCSVASPSTGWPFGTVVSPTWKAVRPRLCPRG